MSPIETAVLNPQVLITMLITVVSLLVCLLLGNHFGTEAGSKKAIPKLVVNTTQQLAHMLAKVEEGTFKISDEDKIALINALLQNLDEDMHPDTDLLHYISTEVINKRHPSQIYEVWLTRSYRRLSANPSDRLPEAWFVEPVSQLEAEAEAETNSDSDTSGIAHVQDEDEDGFETEAGPLVSPNLSSNNLSFETDEINTAHLPEEVGLPNLDMSAVD